jgi:hypothetical protein
VLAAVKQALILHLCRRVRPRIDRAFAYPYNVTTVCPNNDNGWRFGDAPGERFAAMLRGLR